MASWTSISVVTSAKRTLSIEARRESERLIAEVTKRCNAPVERDLPHRTANVKKSTFMIMHFRVPWTHCALS